jgi:hypothetical protein
MRYRTPAALVEAAARNCISAVSLQFDLDACAEDSSHHGKLGCYSAERSCLLSDWGKDFPGAGTVWMNPPFGGACVPRRALERAGLDPDDYSAFPGVDAYIRKARDWAWSSDPRSRHQRIACVLVPATFDAGRFELIRGAAEIIFVGRVRFTDVHGVRQNSPPSAHMLLIYYRTLEPTQVTFGLPGWTKLESRCMTETSSER